jgi:uncharacterized protein with PhoU and TrkA domain
MRRGGFTRRWEEFVQEKFFKRYFFQETSTEDLFLIGNDYGLVRVTATKDSLILNSPAIEEKIKSRKFMIMGIHRGTRWISLPEENQAIREGDQVILYGRLNAIHRIFKDELIKDMALQN